MMHAMQQIKEKKEAHTLTKSVNIYK